MKKNQTANATAPEQTITINAPAGEIAPGTLFRARRDGEGLAIALEPVGEEALGGSRAPASANLPPIQVVLTHEDEKRIAASGRNRDEFIAVRRQDLEEKRALKIEREASGI